MTQFSNNFKIRKLFSTFNFQFSTSARVSRERGFTILEIMIAISIMAIITAITIISFASFRSRTDLNGNAQSIVSVLNIAKSNTISSQQASQWGVHFETNLYALFRGATYSAADPDTKIYNIPSTLEISSIALNNGGANALFDRITGQTQNHGSITIRKVSQPTDLINITIENSGQTTTTTLNQSPTGTRLIDSRHIHFTYNNNAQNAATLLLSFPDYPADNVSIAFQNYLTPAKDSFSWEQVVTVNGVPRTIRISSHLLNSSQTDFSVHRERENNTEGMALALDGENLINYLGNGVESQGVSAWVTAPVRQ